MKSLVLFALLLTPFVTQAYREVGNGAGGIVSDGQYSTFYSSKIPVQPDPLDAHSIPGMSLLLNQISSFDIFDTDKARLLENIFPCGNRNYYAVDADKMDSDLHKELIEKYAQLMNVPPDHVVIYALTDPKTQDTFLMPEFFKLTLTEQAAVLFHESLWILSPSMNYDQIVTSEQAIQAYLEHPENDQIVYKFWYQMGQLSGDKLLPLRPLLHREYDKGFPWAPKQTNPAGILLKDLFGMDFLSCMANAYYAPQPDTAYMNRCNQSLYIHLLNMSYTYPSSISLKYMIDYLKAGGLINVSIESVPNESYELNARLPTMVTDLSKSPTISDDNMSYSVDGDLSGALEFYF